jgi:Mg2+/Co2+ transporter CorB
MCPIMNEHPYLLVILLGLLVLSAFFSASEAALISLNKIRLRHMLEKKKRGAMRVHRLISRMDRLIATILVGNNMVNTAIAAISTVLLTHVFGQTMGLFVGTITVTVILVIFGELIPKVFATSHPEWFAFSVRHVISITIWVFGPITNLLTWIANGFIRFFGGNPHYRSPLVTEEEMKMMITIGKEEGFYGDNERKMLERIFHFDEIEVRDVMTPTHKMVMVSLADGVEELERVLMEEGHNRIPVYDGTRDHIVGILYVRDLLYLFKEGTLIRLGDLLSAPYFVSSNKKATELLKEFQSKKIQIAIVKDAKTHKIAGLVTLEDLVEEIIGDVSDVEVKR